MPYLDNQLPIPFTGRSPQARHASYSGAKVQAEKWTDKQRLVLATIQNEGLVTRQELAFLLSWPISSVCSVVDSIRAQLQEVGFENKAWPDGRTTRRVLLAVKK